MLSQEIWMDIKQLQRDGLSQRAIARMTGHSRNTIARTLAQKAPAPFATPARSSSLDSFKDYLRDRYEEVPLSSVRLLEEIRPMGYTGSIYVLRRFIKALSAMDHAAARATVRFETPPGAQAQADWASCGRLPSGQKVYAFIMVLGYSRMCYVEFTTSMAIPALLRCHMNAFEFFGGIAKAILYDNMKQVRIDRFRYNAQFLDFAGHYGFAVKTHQPSRPRTKGKVERLVDYLKDNFVLGRDFADLADINAQGRHWMDNVANVRIHATTGARPVDLLTAERDLLAPVRGVAPYQIYELFEHKVDTEGFVRAAGSRYSVPPAFIERRVVVCVGERKVLVRHRQGGKDVGAGLIIAEHDRASAPGQSVADKDHIAQLWQVTVERAQAKSSSGSGQAATSLALWRAQTADSPVEIVPLSRYEEAAAL
jgi:transposase